jgi:hypothetical protein
MVAIIAVTSVGALVVLVVGRLSGKVSEVSEGAGAGPLMH